MQQMDVKPPAAAAREPLSMVLGVLEAGLAQVHVHVDEAGRDDHAGGVEDFGLRRGEIRRDTGDASIDDEHVGDAVRVATRGR